MSTNNGSVLGASTTAGAVLAGINVLPNTAAHTMVSTVLILTIISGVLVLASALLKTAYVKQIAVK